MGEQFFPWASGMEQPVSFFCKISGTRRKDLINSMFTMNKVLQTYIILGFNAVLLYCIHVVQVEFNCIDPFR